MSDDLRRACFVALCARLQFAEPVADVDTVLSLPCSFLLDANDFNCGKWRNQITLSHMRSGITGVKILILEDDLLSLELFEYMLKQQDAVVQKASSVAEAIDILNEWQPDILLSDIGMPGEDGISLIEKLRTSERYSEIPVVALTGYGSAVNQEKLRKAGYTAILIKPIDPDTLISALEEIVRA